MYELGKHKEYRNIIKRNRPGVPDVSNENPDLSEKRRISLALQSAPPTSELTKHKPIRGGHINEAIKEIIYNLEKFDTQPKEVLSKRKNFRLEEAN